jgi:competence protein ComEA
MGITQKELPPLKIIPIQQKGLLFFALLMVCFLGVHYGPYHLQSSLQGKQTSAPQDLVIELSGEISRPGIFCYSGPPTITRVMTDGGGSGLEALLVRSERNALITEDASLTIRRIGEKVTFKQEPLSPKALWILGRPIPLNRAREEDLDRLPGIGPVMARRIIEFRETRGGFTSLEELKKVKGIKEKTFEKIKGYLSL